MNRERKKYECSPFRLVHGDEHRDETDTKTGDDTTDVEKSPLSSTCLHGDTSAEDQVGDEEGGFTTEKITKGLKRRVE